MSWLPYAMQALLVSIAVYASYLELYGVSLLGILCAWVFGVCWAAFDREDFETWAASETSQQNNKDIS